MTAYILPEGALTSHTMLVTALQSLEEPSLRTEAIRLIREGYEPVTIGSSVEDWVTRCAQALILGLPIQAPTFKPVRNPVDRRTFEVLATAWVVWAAGGDPDPFLANVPQPSEYGGALHLMALEPWGKAIQALGEGNQEEAVRWFRRSVEFGAQYDIETSDAIQWSYVATVLHRGT